VALLVTSRHQIFLDGSSRLDLDVMPAEEARSLLRGIVGARRATDAELDTLTERCGRLPLALRAAGAYLQFRPGLAVADYLALLSEEHRRLDHLRAPQASRDVRATLALSATLLDADDPELAARWRRLAVFPSTFFPAAAAAVWGVSVSDACESLDRLVARSLLAFEREAERYRLHDLVRTAAGEGLDAVSRLQAELAHAKHFCAVLSRANDLYLAGGNGVLAGLALFEEERTNINLGQRRAATHYDMEDDAARLAYAYTGSASLLALRQPAREQIGWLQDAAAACRALGDQRAESYTLGNLGNAWRGLGETRKAIELYEQMLKVARETGDRRSESNALGSLGTAWAVFGEARKAIELYEQVLEVARETGDRRSESNALGNLGNVWVALGETRKAIEHYEQQLAITREIGDRRGTNTALWNMALAHDSLGDGAAAVVCARESLILHRQIEDPFTSNVEAWFRKRGVDPNAVEDPP